MYPVTQDFLDKIRANERRVYGKVQIDYTDPYLDQSITVTASEQANVSYPAQTADAVTGPYAKFAALDGAWVLGQDWALAPGPEEAELKQMGWWGSQLAEADGSFATPYPTLTVTFFSRPIHSLKVIGDSKRGEYPVDFEIRLYGANDTLKLTRTVTGNTQVNWSEAITPVTEVVKAVLEVRKWSHPGRQAKILEFFTSIQETYEGDDVILIHLLEEREVSQGSLPVGNISANEIDIRLDNSSRKFDAGNTQSPLYQLLKQNRRIRAWLGVEAENNYSQNPPTFSRSSVAYKSDGTQVAANVPRFEPGKFGQAVMVEEGTTNLLTANQSSVETDTIGFIARPNTIISRNTTYAWNGAAGLKVVTDGVGVGEGFHVALPSAAANTTYIGSVYLRGSGTVKVEMRDDTNGVYPGGTVVTLTNAWMRVVAPPITTGGTSPQEDGLKLVIWTTTAQAVTFYADGLQIEQKPYATSWVLGGSTRSSEILTIPTAGVLNPQEGTVECWVYLTGDIAATTPSSHHQIFAHTTGYPNNRLGLQRYAGVLNTWAVRSSDAQGNTTRFDVVWEPSIGWHYFALRWSLSEIALFIDGNKIKSANNPYLPTSLASNCAIGYAPWNNSEHLNSLIDDLRISNRARTDEEIAAAYQSGQPLPVDEWTTYKLTFNGSIYPVEKVWVPLGVFWSGDWSAPEDGVYVQTTGRDRLELLRKSTYSTSQVQVNKTLYDLALAVLQDAELKAEEYWVDTELQQFTVPYAYFEPMSHREALRLIAEACLGQVYVDRNGVVRVEGPSFLTSQTQSVLMLTADDYFRKDNPVKWSEIANYIEVETQPLRPVATAQEVYRSNEPVPIAAGERKTITAYYNEMPCIEAMATLEGAPSGCIIESATYYAWGAVVTVYSPTNAGTFTLVINAKPLKVLNKEKAIAKDDASITDNGLIRYTFPANPLVQTLSMAQTIADKLLASFKNPRRDVEMEWRGNPALLLADRVTVVDKNEQNDYFITRQELEFSGALRAKLSGRRVS